MESVEMQSTIPESPDNDTTDKASPDNHSTVQEFPENDSTGQEFPENDSTGPESLGLFQMIEEIEKAVDKILERQVAINKNVPNFHKFSQHSIHAIRNPDLIGVIIQLWTSDQAFGQSGKKCALKSVKYQVQYLFFSHFVYYLLKTNISFQVCSLLSILILFLSGSDIQNKGFASGSRPRRIHIQNTVLRNVLYASGALSLSLGCYEMVANLTGIFFCCCKMLGHKNTNKNLFSTTWQQYTLLK
jgi:hypothetical protein